MRKREPHEARRGSNALLKALVRAGLLCYICEEQTPVMVDEVGGHICADCRALYLFILERHQRRCIAEQMPQQKLDAKRQKRAQKRGRP